MKTRNALAALTLAFGGLGACERSSTEQPPPGGSAQQQQELRHDTREARYGNPSPAGSSTVAAHGLDASTLQQIADARGAREHKCCNVGPDED
jgi:hypothetical protein